MRKGVYMSLLYHYGSNQKCFGILNDKAIRMSDIRKSNDYEELILLYPDIFEEIFMLYEKSPFEFRYENKNGGSALLELIDSTRYMIDKQLESEEFTNFVVCFSELPDLLSQWRGYAGNGQGISIGFSKKLIQKKCSESNSVFRLEKVEYITEREREEIVGKYAIEAIEMLCDLREWIVENMTHDDSSSETDNLIMFNFQGWIESVLIESLKYKKIGFKEEKEWRLFLNTQAYKNPKWVVGEVQEMKGPNGFSATISLLRNKICFNISENNISPYFSLKLSEFGANVVKEIWIGPKSQISSQDLHLYLEQNNYKDVKLLFSQTSFR